MAGTSDSIQTLLFQRRQLRDCLQELREEINNLHAKANSYANQSNLNPISEQVASKSEKDKDTGTSSDQPKLISPLYAASPQSTSSETAPDPDVSDNREGTAPSSSAGAVVSAADIEEADQPAMPEPVEKPSRPPEVSRFDPVLTLPVTPLRSQQKGVSNEAADEKPAAEAAEKPLILTTKDELPATEPDEDRATSTSVGTEAIAPDKPGDPSGGPGLPPASHTKDLLHHAILLAGFFLHHPSAAGNQLLNQLDAAIQQVEALPEEALRNEALEKLKDAYRNVVAKTYPASRVTGETLSQSGGSIPLLFFLPFTIAVLVLVLMPLLMLLQLVAEQSLEPALAVNLKSLFAGLVAFVWGLSGALTVQAVSAALMARKGQYEKGSLIGGGVISIVGGLLALVPYLVIWFLLDLDSVLMSFLGNLLSYLLGLLGGGLLHIWLHRKSQ